MVIWQNCSRVLGPENVGYKQGGLLLCKGGLMSTARFAVVFSPLIDTNRTDADAGGFLSLDFKFFSL
jgi:hypothetical protein